MESTVEFTDRAVADCDDGSLGFPWRIRHTVWTSESIFVLLQPGKDGAVDPDFTVPSPDRNLVAITLDCDLEWIVEPSGYDGDHYHKHVLKHVDRFITRDSADRFYEIDTATGTIDASWGPAAFKIGDDVVEFDRKVTGSASLGDRVVVSTKTSDENWTQSGTHLYGFDRDGQHLWERTDEFAWRLDTKQGELVVWDEPSRSKILLGVDPDTGEFYEHEYTSKSVPDELLSGYG